MIGFIEEVPCETGRFPSFREKRRRKPYASLYCGTGREKIYKVTVFQRKDHKEYEEFAQRFSALRGRLLAPEGASLPEEVKRMLYQPERYRIRLFADTAVSLLSQMETGWEKPVVGVWDQRGVFLPYLTELLPFAGRLDIATGKTGAYEKLADRLYNEYGAAISVGRTPEQLFCSRVVLAVDVPERVNGARVRRCLSADHIHLSGAVRLAGVRPPLDVLLPPGIGSIAFCGAMAEKCGNAKAGILTASTFEYNGKIISKASALEIMTIT